jgi:hypothetical protein
MMVPMRQVVLASMALVGCRTSVAVAPPPSSCVTSFVCPTGQRCEDGLCTPDVSCPGPMTPRLLYDASQANGDVEGNFEVIDGHEYWAGPYRWSAAGDTESWFIDLATKARSTLEHPPGNFGCSDPSTCTFYPRGAGPAVLYTDVHFDEATQAWVLAAAFTLPAGFFILARDQPGPGQWLVYDPTTLAAWTPTSGQIEPILSFNSTQSLVGVVDTPGRPKMISRLDNVSLPKTISTAPLMPGGSFTTIFTFEGARDTASPVPAGDGGWFLVYDHYDDGNPDLMYKVLRSSLLGQTMVGASSDPVVGAVGVRYRFGSPTLEGGTRGKGATCAVDTCYTAEVDLATVSVKPTGTTTIPGAAHLVDLGNRWLACDAVEVLALEWIWDTPQQTGMVTEARLHLLRVLASQ